MAAIESVHVLSCSDVAGTSLWPEHLQSERWISELNGYHHACKQEDCSAGNQKRRFFRKHLAVHALGELRIGAKGFTRPPVCNFVGAGEQAVQVACRPLTARVCS